MNLQPAIEWCGVSKAFAAGWRGRRVHALNDFTLTVAAGTAVALVGPNGSGKSTAIKIALNLVNATAGHCRIFGGPSTERSVRNDIGYLPEAPHFYRHLTGKELLRFYGQMSGLSSAEVTARADDVIVLVGLEEAAGRRVATYSKGMLQRIGLAQAIIHDPKILILDEPTAGVDAAGVREMILLLLRLKALGKTLLLTSHIDAEIVALCDHVAVLECGRLVRVEAVAKAPDHVPADSLVVAGMTRETREELTHWLKERGSWIVPGRAARTDAAVARIGSL